MRDEEEATNGAKTEDDEQDFPQPLAGYIQLMGQHLQEAFKS